MASYSTISVTEVPRQKSVGRNAFLARLRAASTSRVLRIPVVLAIHAALIITASYFAWWLRFDGAVPPGAADTFAQTVLGVLAIRGLVFVPFGLYGGLWRYTSIWDLSRIVAAVLTSSLALYLLIYRDLGPAGFPRSIIIIDSLLLISFLGGARLFGRIIQSATRSTRGRRVLIVGAGDAGEMIVREMRRFGGYQPIGFIDDDPAKVGRTIHGVEVLGTRDDLPRVVMATRPQEVLIAIPTAKAAAVRGIVHLLEAFKLPITTLPGLEEMVNGKVGVKHIRPLAIEDLLPRKPVALNTQGVRGLVGGKRVLVTGAGGSIGSELCRQIAALEPASLILLERYENSLYAITNDLADRGLGASVHPTIGDVTDASRMEAVFAEHRPHLVFHAAAHKHVPLMEANPCEAVKNNVLGTNTVAEAARRHGAERFVLISTDKAANPSSVMGATKRVAELIVQAMSGRGDTRFVTVRFGNVLGSNGSVIPRMVEQIRVGGPVTVTHPEIRRYFMLIPEAVELVLQAAVLARSQETFVLDMGEQLKVLDVAKNLIRLSGFVPEEEIPITFIGLRPGEKLTEELVGEGETLEPAGISKIFRVRWSATPDSLRLAQQVEALGRVALQGHFQDTISHLHRLVPTFNTAHAANTTTSVVSAPAGASVVAPAPRRPANPLRMLPRPLVASLAAVKSLGQE
jgi:FlaA1/EpsC-like NDP-sugar epimerase